MLLYADQLVLISPAATNAGHSQRSVNARCRGYIKVDDRLLGEKQ